MLYCPERPPESASSRFPGGDRRSSNRRAKSNAVSFRLATLAIREAKPFGTSPANTIAAAFPRKVLIIDDTYRVSLAMAIRHCLPRTD
jgi:hypothetical protein